MSKKEKKEKIDDKHKTIVEYKGSWVQYSDFDEFEVYDLFLGDNLVMISMSPEAFENLREMFRMLESKNNKMKYVS